VAQVAQSLLPLSAQLRIDGPKGIELAHKFEIYKDKAGEYRVRFKYNSEVMFSTEGYSSKASALNAIESIKKKWPQRAYGR
jgi:uncharacterized protein YegP (UPF0339 family)